MEGGRRNAKGKRDWKGNKMFEGRVGKGKGKEKEERKRRNKSEEDKERER